MLLPRAAADALARNVERRIYLGRTTTHVISSCRLLKVAWVKWVSIILDGNPRTIISKASPLSPPKVGGFGGCATLNPKSFWFGWSGVGLTCKIRRRRWSTSAPGVGYAWDTLNPKP